MRSVYEQGYRVFLEIGPSPILVSMGSQCVPQDEGVWLASLREGRNDWEQMLESLARIYVSGAKVDWAGFDRGHARRKLSLPTYPFQRQRYWIEKGRDGNVPPRAEEPARSIKHPILTRRLNAAIPIVEGSLSLTHLPYLADHRVSDLMVAPGALLIEMVQAACEDIYRQSAIVLEALNLNEALVIPEKESITVQLVFAPEGDSAGSFQVFSAVEVAAESPIWKLHASGKVHVHGSAALPIPGMDTLSEVRKRCIREAPVEAFYQQLEERQIKFGSQFRTMRRLWHGKREALGEILLPDTLTAEAVSYRFHPVLLDGCVQVLGAAMAQSRFSETYLQTGLGSYRTWGKPTGLLYSHARLHKSSDKETQSGDIYIYDASGRLVAEIAKITVRQVDRQSFLRLSQEKFRDRFYEVRWEAKPLSIRLAPNMSSPSEIASRIGPQLESLASRHELDLYAALLPQMEEASAGFVIRAFQKMGWTFSRGQRVSPSQAAAELRIPQTHHRLLNRMLSILGEEEILGRLDTGDWEIVAVPPEGNPESLCLSLEKQFPAYRAALALLRRCGTNLVEVLQGKQDPLQLLFPNGEVAEAESLYKDSPSALVFNTLLAEAVSSAINRLPAGRRLRVLEIGAGTGSSTTHILPRLPRDAEYFFTDIAPTFTARAKVKFQEYPAVQYRTLDIEQSPTDQGFAAHSFDLVIAANVLHATKDLSETLHHVCSLLASEGLLLLLEGTGRQRWVDLTFGLTAGWWRFTDTQLRPCHALLTTDQWVNFLETSGFTQVQAIPSSASAASQALFFALGPKIQQHCKGAVSAQNGTWVVLAEQGGLGTRLAYRLRQQFHRCLLVYPSNRYGQLAPDEYQVDPSVATHFEQALRDGLIGKPDCRGIVYAWEERRDGPDGPAIGEKAARQCTSITMLLQALQRVCRSARMWLITRGAQAVEGGPANLVQLPIWGLGRVMALEHPEAWGGVIDLDGDGLEIEQILAELTGSDGEDQVAYRKGERYVPRLIRSRPAPSKPYSFEPDSSYLITGGLGGLGLQTALWMAREGARNLVLLGRHGVPPRSQWDSVPGSSDLAGKVEALRAIELAGASVTVVAADVADFPAMQELFSRFGRTLPPLRGLIHAAVEMSEAPLSTLDAHAVNSMLHAKIAGSWVLHSLTRELDLAFFVLFSSTTSLWGARGLAHYAAANQFLDGLAHWRRAQGLPALAINWGTWDVMRVASNKEKEFFASVGLKLMPAAEALTILGGLLGSEAAQVAVASVDWRLLKPVYESRGRRLFLERMVTQESVTPREDHAPRMVPRWEFDGMNPLQRRQVLADRIRGEVARVLGLDATSAIDSNRGLFEMGMDSLMSVELKSRLEARLGKPLPSTLTFNYPNVVALTDFIAARILGFDEAPKEESSPPAQARAAETNADQLSEAELEQLLIRKLQQL